MDADIPLASMIPPWMILPQVHPFQLVRIFKDSPSIPEVSSSYYIFFEVRPAYDTLSQPEKSKLWTNSENPGKLTTLFQVRANGSRCEVQILADYSEPFDTRGKLWQVYLYLSRSWLFLKVTLKDIKRRADSNIQGTILNKSNGFGGFIYRFGSEQLESGVAL